MTKRLLKATLLLGGAFAPASRAHADELRIGYSSPLTGILA